ncbi:MAG: bacterial Ig-like domain-containing protein [Clostridiales bacterium]|nr:bacterial Ig-like domain-containing protein [Clostridiales bacterium]
MKSNIKQGAFIVLIIVVLSSLCGVLLVGCTDNTVDEQEKVVTGITLDVRNAQTEFFVGDKFSTLGLGIVVSYQDGSQGLMLASGEDVDILEPALDSIGRKKVSVQYKGFLAEYTVNVSRLDGIELGLSNVQVDYTVGDEFSAYGLTVSAKITTLNDLNEEVTSYKTLSATDYTVTAPDMSTAGQKTVTVTYKDKTANYTVTVNAAPVLESITVDASKAKTKFRVGDTFTYDGLVVTAIYSDNNEKVVADYTVTAPDMSTVGVKTVTVTYEGKTANYTINVLGEDSDPILTGIRLDVSSVKLVYRAGDPLDTTGLVVTGTYDVGQDQTLNSTDYTVNADLSQAGEIAVTVAAQGFEQHYTVYVLPKASDVWNTLETEAQGGSNNKLTIYALSCTGNGNGTPSLTQGWSFFELANGGYRLLPFTCDHLGPNGGWGTNFPSNGEATTSIGSSGELVVVYGGVTYTAEENYWHARILDWTNEATIVTLTTDGELSYVVGSEFNWQVTAVVANLKTGSKNVDITDKCVITVSQPNMSEIGATTVTVTIVYTYDDFGITRTQTVTERYAVLIRPDVETADTIVFDTVNGATLELFVTERNVDGIATKGVIFYKSAGGVYEVIGFTYADGELTVGSEQWTASFDQEGNLTVANADVQFTCTAAIVNTVLLKEEKTLLGIFWNEKREYVVGSAFEFNPVRKYSDGSTEPLATDEYTATEPDMNTIGVKTVTLSYLADSSYDITFQIYCIPSVNWDTNKLDFGTDTNGSGATLELFITERSTAVGGWGWADQNTKGWLLVKNTDGTYEMYEYAFYLGWDVSSHPYPDGAPEGLNSYLNDGGNLVIEINGKTFIAWNNDLWHLIVIGWQ